MSDKRSGLDPEIVRELASILRDTDLTEIEIELGETRMRLARTVIAAAPAAAAPMLAMHAPAPVSHAPAPAPAAAEAPARSDARSHPGAVLSPMVGTAYIAPEPGAAAFVKVGDQVTEGQTLMIVEAMKTMNSIPAPRAGRVVEILVADAQPVEFGEPLLVIG
jgi:acetyl-CoA carboxylase biotin carboxyl carrier protein